MSHHLGSATALAALLGGAALVALTSSENRADAAASQQQSTYSQLSFALEFGGVKAGRIRSASGGNARGAVTSTTTGTQTNKRIGQVSYTAMTVSGDGTMRKDYWDWVGTAVAASGSAKDGMIVLYDDKGERRSRQLWYEGRISEVEFPALARSDTQPVYLRVVIKPQTTKRESASGHADTPSPRPGRSWTSSSYALTINGLEQATSKVSRIEPLVVRITGTKVDVSNLVIYLRSAEAQPLYAWHDDFVVKGNGSDSKEKTGTLTYLNPGDASDVLATIGLRGLGIIEVGPDPAGDVQTTRAEMYVESVTFSTKP
jgi:hypothetical protein